MNSTSQGRSLVHSLQGDTLLAVWADYFRKRYNIDEPFDSDWNISNGDGTITFADMLARNKGHVLYVDVWASWCAKSISEYPALESLKRRDAEGGLVVANISVDTDLRKWKWAEGKYLAFNLANSYLLDSVDLPKFSRSFVVNSIPRYLLFDERGNLIHGNAPRPGSDELRRLLEGNLTKVGGDRSPG